MTKPTAQSVRRECIAQEKDIRRARTANFIAAAAATSLSLAYGSEVSGSYISQLVTSEHLHTNNPTVGAGIMLGGVVLCAASLARAAHHDSSLTEAEDQTRQATNLMLQNK